MNANINVVIVDDHPMVVDGLKSLLNEWDAIVITGTFSSGKAILDEVQSFTADVILLDVSLPDANGVDLCKEILTIRPEVKILGMSTYSDVSIIKKMISNGALGYLLKNTQIDYLVQAIMTVQKSKLIFSPEVEKLLIEDNFNEKPRLTRRETEVLQLLAEGETSQQIASKLFLSPLTIDTHRKNLMQKLRVNNVAALIRAASDLKLL